MMTFLAFVLIVKIAVTVVVIGGAMFFPAETLNEISGWQVAPVLLYRLFGAAALALIVSYSMALVQHLKGVGVHEAPVLQAVIVGVVSNASAGGLLLVQGSGYPFWSGFIFAAIAIGLLACLLVPSLGRLASTR